MSDEHDSPERRVDSASLMRAIDRIDKRTERMEKRLFFGNGGESIEKQITRLDTQVVHNATEIGTLRKVAEHAGGRSGAQWGAVISTAIVTAATAFWAIVTGRPPGGGQ